MQLRHWASGAVLAGALGALAVRTCAAQDASSQPFVTTSVRTFTDSDHVRVRSLITDWLGNLGKTSNMLSLHWNNEQVTIPAISAPPGSQAAVDAITTASRPISGNAYSDFVKTRNEVEAEVSNRSTAVNYYVSSEPDYLAQQIGGRYNRDMGNPLLNLSFGSSYGWDDIKPLPDDLNHTAASSKTTLYVNSVATRILSPSTLLRAGGEYFIVNGLQHSPYRNVYAGGVYVPENHPDHRERRDLFLRLNQYLPNRSSIKLNYRLYNDDWGILSHEIDSSLSQYITQGVWARYEYRYYTQTPADFYRHEYATTNGINGYLTGDYRLGDLSSHLFGSSLHWGMDALAADHPVLSRTTLWLDYERYFNSNNYSANILEAGLDFHFQ